MPAEEALCIQPCRYVTYMEVCLTGNGMEGECVELWGPAEFKV